MNLRVLLRRGDGARVLAGRMVLRPQAQRSTNGRSAS